MVTIAPITKEKGRSAWRRRQLSVGETAVILDKMVGGRGVMGPVVMLHFGSRR